MAVQSAILKVAKMPDRAAFKMEVWPDEAVPGLMDFPVREP